MFAGVTHQNHGPCGLGAIEEKHLAAGCLGCPDVRRIHRSTRDARPAGLRLGDLLLLCP